MLLLSQVSKSYSNTVVTQENVLQIRQRIGYVIQEGDLFPHLTVRDNVVIMVRYLHRDSAWINS